MILFKEALCQKASDGSSFVECLNKQGVLAGIKVDEVCIQMLSSVFVQPGLAFYLHKYCISIATPHSSICTKGPLCNVINLQHLFFVAGQCSFLQHDYGLTVALSRNMSKSSSFAAIAELYVEKLYVVTRCIFFSSTYYACLTLCFSIQSKSLQCTANLPANGFVTSDLFAFQGLVPFEGHEGETVTRGLEHLEANCQQYYRYPCSHHFVVALLP